VIAIPLAIGTSSNDTVAANPNRCVQDLTIACFAAEAASFFSSFFGMFVRSNMTCSTDWAVTPLLLCAARPNLAHFFRSAVTCTLQRTGVQQVNYTNKHMAYLCAREAREEQFGIRCACTRAMQLADTQCLSRTS
jgi:hypothetical protein